MEPSIKLPLSLLQNDIPASWIDVPKCLQCDSVFHKTNKVQHYPCRLSCGHILCSTCLIAIGKNKNKTEAKCGQCSQKIQQNDSSGWYQLDYDYSLMGFIHYQKNIVPHMLQYASNAPNFDRPTDADIVSVCVECTISTKSICVECVAAYCDPCFAKVHAAGVALKKHQLKHLDAKCSAIGSPLGLCNTHNKKMLYYCVTCSVPICDVCPSGSHRNHTTKELFKVNKDADLDEPLNTLKDVRDMIEASKKSTVECIAKLDNYATATAQDIFKTFQNYHSILQNLEDEAYVDLKQRTLATLEELHNVQNTIDVSGSLIAGAISNIKQFKKVTPRDVDLSSIFNKIMTFLETLMIDFDAEQFDNNLFRFDINRYKINCDLKDLCKLKLENSEFYAKMQTFFSAKKHPVNVDASSSYPDMSSNSSGDDLNMSPIKATKSERTLKTQKHEPIMKSKSERTLKTHSGVPVNKSKLEQSLKEQSVRQSKHAPTIKPKLEQTLKDRSGQQSKREPTIRSCEVLIKEISDPMIFYVQDFDFIDRANQLVEQCNECAMVEKTPSTVVVGEMYLVFETNKDVWHRGIVTEQKKKISLYLVDYGRHVLVMLNQIRRISENLKAIPPSSSSFTMCNVEPTGGKWSEECKELVLQMALDNKATLIYTEENAGDCIVHLDYPTSIEETLLYLNFATSRQICNETENQLRRNMMREKVRIMTQLNENKPFAKHVIKDESYCNVTNIVSPSNLYLTSIDHVSDVEALHNEMQEFYDKPYHQTKVYYPHLKMACCVLVDQSWYRARVESHLPNCMVKVYLVDVGKYMNIEWRFLRALSNQFNNLPEGVVECCLAHISPKNYAEDWGPDVTVELKRLCKPKLRVGVIGKLGRNGTVNVELYIVKKTVNYQINAYLAHHQFVEWIGEGDLIIERPNDVDAEVTDESVLCAAIPNDTPSKEFRQLVKILYTVSPSEFFVTLIKYQAAINKMHIEIQDLMKSYEAETDIQHWQTGDNCLVFGKLSKDLNQKTWYRGQIKSFQWIDEPNAENHNFCVYIRDHGQTILAELTDLAPIPPSLGLVVDGATKCHLANLKPTSTDWAKAAISEFNYIIHEDCDTFAISVHGEITSDSIPVYLWGRKKPIRDCALGAELAWININSEIATKGFADCTEAFKTIADCNEVDIISKEMMDFNKWHEMQGVRSEFRSPSAKQSNVLRDDDDFILDAELDPDHESFAIGKVTAWLPAKPIPRYYFNAFVTYVDNNAVIYLHEQCRGNFLRQIMYTIKKVIDLTEYDAKYKWKENEPCMAQYYLDGNFYRGLVKAVMPNDQYKILFVDYGNIETCDSCDLRAAEILGNVPIQSTKYYLAYVKPINDTGIWDKKILEFIHHSIVNKTVAIRVEDNIDHEYVPCTLNVGVMDLIKTLINEKLAELSDTLKMNFNVCETYSFYSQKSDGPIRDIDLYKESSMPLDEFKEEIAKKKEATKVKEHLQKFDFDQSIDFIVEDSDADVHRTRDSMDYEGEFRPHDSSTTISTAMKSISLLPFKQIQLSDDVTKFSCKIFEVLDTQHLFVEPIIQQYTANFESMENKIKNSKQRKSSNFNVSNARCCLAPYSEDKCYYRAVITDRISKTSARIQFVDYLNQEVVDCKLLRECPADAMAQPLKHLVVKLHGVKPSRRIRDSDIKRKLENLLGQTAVAVVVGNDDIPSVRLYDNNDTDVLLYKSLIDSKFYTETRD